MCVYACMWVSCVYFRLCIDVLVCAYVSAYMSVSRVSTCMYVYMYEILKDAWIVKERDGFFFVYIILLSTASCR